MLKVFLNVLIICLITTGIIMGQGSPVLTTGPENGHLIIAGGNLRDTAYQMPADSKEFYFGGEGSAMICAIERLSNNLYIAGFSF